MKKLCESIVYIYICMRAQVCTCVRMYVNI